MGFGVWIEFVGDKEGIFRVFFEEEGREYLEFRNFKVFGFSN